MARATLGSKDPGDRVNGPGAWPIEKGIDMSETSEPMAPSTWDQGEVIAIRPRTGLCQQIEDLLHEFDGVDSKRIIADEIMNRLVGPALHAARKLAHCETSVQAGANPEEGEGCPELREPGSVYCKAHMHPPLIDTKTEWGNRTPWGSVSPAPNEQEARRMFWVALPGQRVLVSREVGPWTEAEHRELPHVYWPDPDEPGQRCACPIGADHSADPA